MADLLIAGTHPRKASAAAVAPAAKAICGRASEALAAGQALSPASECEEAYSRATALEVFSADFALATRTSLKNQQTSTMTGLDRAAHHQTGR